MTPKVRSYLAGVAIGVVVFAAVAMFPFASIGVAFAAAVVMALLGVLFCRSMFDPQFLAGWSTESPWSEGLSELQDRSPDVRSAYAFADAVEPSGEHGTLDALLDQTAVHDSADYTGARRSGVR